MGKPLARHPQLDRHVMASLPALGWGLGGLYLAYAVVHLASGIPAAPWLLLVWVATAAALGLTATWVRLRPPPESWAHGILGLQALAVLAATIALLWVAQGSVFLVVLVLTVLGFAVLALDVRWYALFAGASILGWVALVASGRVADPAPASILLASSLAVGLLAQLARVRTHVRLLEEQESRVQAELEAARAQQAQAVQRRILNLTGHELFTPLTPLVTTASRLEELAQAGSPVPLADAQRLRRNVDRLGVWAQRAMEAARITGEAARVRLEPADLGALLRGVASGLAAAAQARGKTLRVDGEASADVDVRMVREAVAYLAQIALDGTRPDVVMRLEQGPHRVRLCVDGGAEMAVAGRASDTGLAEYVARRVAELHGGTLEAADAAGGALTMVLPRHRPQASG